MSLSDYLIPARGLKPELFHQLRSHFLLSDCISPINVLNTKLHSYIVLSFLLVPLVPLVLLVPFVYYL